MKVRRKDDIEVFCKYCECATPLSSDEIMVCSVNGVVRADHRCRKFSYDPLKRTPKRNVIENKELDFPNIND